MNYLSLTSISSATWDIAPYNHETCVCTYFLPEVGEVQIWTNPIGQLHGVWKNEGKSNSIFIEDIEGIPLEARLNPCTFEAFLKDTYLRLKDKSNPLMGIRIMPRLKGGGNFPARPYHYTHSCTYRLTHWPNTFNYSAGFPIRYLSCPPVEGGEFTRTQGGLNDNQWSTIFVSVRPRLAENVRVTIHVWKKDFHANRINELSELKNRAVQDLTSKDKELGSIEAKVKDLSTAILLQQSNLERLTKELTEVSAENQRIDASSSLNAASIALTEREMRLKAQIVELEHKILAQENEVKTASITIASLQKERSADQQSFDNFEKELVRLNTEEVVIYSKVGTNDWTITGV